MRWPPYQHIFFDCDSTLTAVEGIDALAAASGKKWRVEVLTRAAMEGELDLEDVYDRRLRAVKPTRAQIAAVRQQYKEHIVEDTAAVIDVLQYLGHKVYIISGGLAEPVVEFGLFLGVPRDQIRAVGIQYNQLSGQWWRNSGEGPNREMQYMEHQSGALTVSDGKAQVVRELLGEQAGRSLLVGDGMSDLYAGRAVDLFVGYGGVVVRPQVKAQATCFLHSRSLAPLLALASGPAMLPYLKESAHEDVGRKSLDLVEKGAITFQDERLREKFRQACKAVYPRTD